MLSTNEASWQLRSSIEQFLFLEARLLDERRFTEWLDLLTDDLSYVMPTRVNKLERDRRVSDPNTAMPIFDETKESLTIRIKRLLTGMAWAEDPPSRARHFITNVEILSSEGADFWIRSNFLVNVSRMDENSVTFTGFRNDCLRRGQEGGWKLRSREIVTDHTVISSNNLSLFF